MWVNSCFKLLALGFELLISILLVHMSLDKVASELGFVQIVGLPMGMALFAFSRSGRLLCDLKKIEIFLFLAVLVITFFSLPSAIDPLMFFVSIIMFLLSFYSLGKKRNVYFSRYIFNLFFLRSLLICSFVYGGFNVDYLLVTIMAIVLIVSVAGENETLFERPKPGFSFSEQFLLSYLQGLMLYLGYWYVASYDFEHSSEFRLLLQVSLLPLVFQQVSNQTNFDKIIVGSIVNTKWLLERGRQAAKYSLLFVCAIYAGLFVVEGKFDLFPDLMNPIESFMLVDQNLGMITLVYIMILLSVLLGPLAVYYRLNVPLKVNLSLLFPLVLAEFLIFYLMMPQMPFVILITVLFTLIYKLLMFLRVKYYESINGGSAPSA